VVAPLTFATDYTEAMDMTWVTDRLALGGGIWNEQNMIEVVKHGITHVINMQIEFDDRHLCEPYDVKVLWNATDDDFQPKSAELLDAGVQFALEAMKQENAKVYVHCAAGVHRAPMMTLAILRAMGWKLEDAMETVQSLRPVVDWADVYVKSVEKYIAQRCSSVL
jgi:protein-tyrosine phosphatase